MSWARRHPVGPARWVWIALERETRRIVGLAFGGGQAREASRPDRCRSAQDVPLCPRHRSSETCVNLWNSLPADYRKRAVLYSDFWSAYAEVLPKKRHFAVGKESGETAHIERFNNTLRQRAGPRGCRLAQDSGVRIWCAKPYRSVNVRSDIKLVFALSLTTTIVPSRPLT